MHWHIMADSDIMISALFPTWFFRVFPCDRQVSWHICSGKKKAIQALVTVTVYFQVTNVILHCYWHTTQ